MKTTFSVVPNQDLRRRKSAQRGTAAVPAELQNKIIEVDMQSCQEGVPELYFFQFDRSVTLESSGGGGRGH